MPEDTPPSSSILQDNGKFSISREELGLIARHSRCRVCSHILRDPVTLSCGNSICHSCLPPFDPHTVWKFECPIAGCKQKSHLFGSIIVDVSLLKIADIIQKEIDIYQKAFPHNPSSSPVASDSESVTDDEEGSDSPLSPSMAFLESDLWSDGESTATPQSPEEIGNTPSSNDPEPLELPNSVSFPDTSKEIPLKDRLLSELECQICYLLFYHPITTPCGHTFCKNCILRSIDHTDKCPLCRHKLPGYNIFYNHPLNSVIHNISATIFPQLYNDRRLAAEAEIFDSLDDTPIFVCSLVFPNMPLFLHIFEPRYRLMLRRCLESENRRFGMVLPGKNGEPFKEYGTMVDITNVTMLPDGRAMIETKGSFRFRVIERGIRDGYNTGKIERIEDISPEEEEEIERAELAVNNTLKKEEGDDGKEEGEGLKMKGEGEEESSQNHRYEARTSNNPGFESEAESSTARSSANSEREVPTSLLISQARLFVEQLKNTSAPWLLQRLSLTFGDIPENDSDFSWWLASVLPIDDHERSRLLEVTSIRQRMKIITGWIKYLREQWWFSRGGCVVM